MAEGSEETRALKWEGKASVELQTTTADHVWPLFHDFCNIHKWLPTLDTCRYVQGVHGEPGLVRYCATTVQPSSPPPINADPIINWCYEKLLSIDAVQRRLSYEIGENNLGFTFYVAEITVSEIDGGGCRIEWEFTMDPVEGMRLEDLCGYIESSLKAMAVRMEENLQEGTNGSDTHDPDKNST